MTLDITQMDELDGDYNPAWKVYQAALHYIEAGYYVVPIVKGGKALPPKKYGISYGNAAITRKTINKWFDPDDGKFAGWNVGIATGRENGVFVMDVDRHGAEDGFKTLQGILDEEQTELPAGPCQATPNGGMHYLFRWQENATSSTGKIGPAIDTRGGTLDSCKGHIVAFPSIVDGKQYKWMTSGPLPDIPKWVMARMGVPWKPAKPLPSGRGNENVEDADVEETVPMEQVQRLLRAIDPNSVDYDEWLRIGMAIKSQYPDDDGLAAWDGWSAYGEKYEPTECTKRWEGFDDLGATRMATLFHYANEHGHVPEPTDKKPNKLGMVVERMNEYHAIVVIGNKIRILQEIEGEVEEMATPYNLLGRQDFRTLFENDTVCTDPAKGKYVSVSDIWLGDPSRRTYPKGMGMFPNGEPDGYYNTWRGFAITAKQGDCSLFTQHIREVICGGDATLATFVLDWCADLFQDPANPKGTAIVMRGDEGTGKGTFADTIGMMCAPHYTHLIDEAHLTGQFNAHMSESVVVFGDEITWGGNVKTAGKLKGLVTERHMLLERKGIDAVTQRNMAHVFIASNSKWVIPAGAKSRRWLILDINDKYRVNKSYFTAIYKEMHKQGGMEAFLYDMQHREITSDLSTAPETEALQEHREMSTTQEDTILRWWKHCLSSERILIDDLEDENSVGWPKIVACVDLYEHYEQYCMDRRIHAQIDNPFYKQMVQWGLVQTRKRIPGGRIRGYKIPPIELALKKLEQYTGIKIKEFTDEES